MAEFMRALRTLKALQAEQAIPIERPAGTMIALEGRASKPAALAPGAPVTDRSCRLAPPQPNGAKRPGRWKPVMEYATPNEPEPDRRLHEAGVRWRSSEAPAERNPDEPETRGFLREITGHESPRDREGHTPPGCLTD